MIGRTSLIVSMHPVLQIKPSSRKFHFVRHQPDVDTGAHTTNHTVDEVLKIGRGVSGDPCGGSEFGDALDG